MDAQPNQPYPFRTSISEIEPGLFVGNENVSCCIPVLREKNITSIVSVVRDPQLRWSGPVYRSLVPENQHLFIAALDSDTQDLLVHMTRICDFIDEQLASSNTTQSTESSNVLVHCAVGVSRSATVAIAYLMRKRCESLDATLEFVRKRRKVKPSENFMDQLRVWQEVEYDIWEDPAKSIPKTAYKAFLAKRAERLRAKGLTGDEPVGIGNL